MTHNYSVNALDQLLFIAETYCNVRGVFHDAGHEFAALFVDSRYAVANHVADAVAAHPDIDPEEMGAVLSIYFKPTALISSDAPESIRSGFVFPLCRWDASHETNELEDCREPVELDYCRKAADPALLEAFRSASQCAVDHTPTTKTGWLVYVLTAEHGAERTDRALSAVMCDAMHPEVVFGIVSRSLSSYCTIDRTVAAQILADAFERLACPPLVLPPIII